MPGYQEGGSYGDEDNNSSNKVQSQAQPSETKWKTQDLKDLYESLFFLYLGHDDYVRVSAQSPSRSQSPSLRFGYTCFALCLRLLFGDIGFVYPVMSMVVIDPSLPILRQRRWSLLYYVYWLVLMMMNSQQDRNTWTRLRIRIVLFLLNNE